MASLKISSTQKANISVKERKYLLRSGSDLPEVGNINTVVSSSRYILDSEGNPIGTEISTSTLTVGGLYGQQALGNYRSTISTGDVGVSVPMTNGSLFTSISYSNLGDYYGYMFIGYFLPPTTGTYTFYTTSDDGSGVWVGDIASADTGRTALNAVVNNGLGAGQGATERSGTINLNAGTYYAIRIVHEEGTGGDSLIFNWAGPGISKTTDLTQYYYYISPGDWAVISTVGLNEEYSEQIVFPTSGFTSPSIRFKSRNYIKSSKGGVPRVAGARGETQEWY